MKRVIFQILIFMFMVNAAAAYAGVPQIGFLSRLNTSEEEFARIVQNAQRTGRWRMLSNRHDLHGVKFYDSLTAMLMALHRGEIDELALPEVTAEYIAEADSRIEVCCVSRTNASMSLALGVMKGNTALAEKFNAALREMKQDWSLAELQGVYIHRKGRIKPVKFTEFNGAQVVKVAITGDFPPIDYIDEAGRAAGFNAALLAELGRRMKVNIVLANIEAGARTSALASGRVDAVFWFETSDGGTWKYDAPEGVLLSDPYYHWSKFLHIRRR